MGLENMGKLSKNVPFLSDFRPISYQCHTFCIPVAQCIFGNFSQFPIFLPPPHFPPISPPIFPVFYPFFHFPHFSKPLFRLRLTRKPGTTPNCPSERFLRPSSTHNNTDAISVWDCHCIIICDIQSYPHSCRYAMCHLSGYGQCLVQRGFDCTLWNPGFALPEPRKQPNWPKSI